VLAFCGTASGKFRFTHAKNYSQKRTTKAGELFPLTRFRKMTDWQPGRFMPPGSKVEYFSFMNGIDRPLYLNL